MKRFIKTLPGKTILFICCVLSFCLLLGSVLGLSLYAKDDFRVYTESEETLIQSETKALLEPSGYVILSNVLAGGGAVPYDGLDYCVLDESGQVVAQAGDLPSDKEDVYGLTYAVRLDTYGDLSEIFSEDVEFYSWGTIRNYTVEMWPIGGSVAARQMDLLSSILHLAYALRHWIYIIGIGSLLLTVASFVALMYASARRPDSEELHPGALHKVPFDLLVVLCGMVVYGLLVVALGMGLGYALYTEDGDWTFLVATGAVLVLGTGVILGLAMSAAGRIKTHTLLRNTVVYRIWTVLKSMGRGLLWLLRGVPLVWKTALAAGGFSLLHLIVLAVNQGDPEALLLLWLLGSLVLIPGALYLAMMLRRLQKGGAALAGGDLAYQTDTRGMLWDFRQHGEHLNQIAGGMTIAVEERMRSERMKTELITNVSHDIKTPLTSIINYATLIGEVPETNETVREYAQVLVRQSDKLKRLIEDLVEASRAQTGNLDVVLAPCDPAIFLAQASGEYAEKLAAANLTLVTTQPEQELRVLADGRRMWRIFDNLMNNVCKYAQPHTRVYLSLEAQGQEAVLTLKNTSREPLNLTEEELMERFTRGDASRHTEGNGLGLAIARSIAELQGGRLALAVDGDLFKAILRFPLSQEPAQALPR